MKLKKLVVCAFGPYNLQQTVNFEDFANEGIFLITGDTGSGKTTIFDAICFVLFGEASGQRKQAKTLKSDYSNPKKLCFVELSFEVHGKTYVIKRIPEQLVEKSSSKGLKLQKHKAELILPDGKIKTNLKEINNILVNEVLGVDRDNFNKLIMLPQGQFQKLLTEKGQEQANTFRKLFGTKIYEDVENRLFEEKQNIKKEYDLKVSENLKKLEGYVLESKDYEKIKSFDFSEKLNFFLEQNSKETRELKDMEKKIKDYDLKIKTLQETFLLKEQFEKKQIEKKELEQKKENLKGSFDDLEDCFRKKQLLYRIENLKTLYDIWNEKKQYLKKKQQQLKVLEEDLKTRQEKFKYALNRFEKLSCFEEEKENLTKKHSEFLVMLNNFNLAQDVEFKIRLAEKELIKIRDYINKLQTKIELKNLMIEIEERKRINSICKTIINSKKEFLNLQKELKNLNKKYLLACRDFYENQAFNLAKNLKKGKACPVCGALEHPNPKKDVSCQVVGEGFLEKLREEIFVKKDCLNEVYVKIKTQTKSLKEFEKFEYFNHSQDDLGGFLEESLKDEVMKSGFLKQRFKEQEANFNVDLKENYEKYLDKSVAECENFEKNILDLKTQKKELLATIPLNLQKKSLLMQHEKFILKKKKELEEQIYDITKEKQEQEKKINSSKTQKKALEQNIFEIGNEEKSLKKQFFLRLEQNNISFEEILKFFDEFEILKAFVEKFEIFLKEKETIELKIKTLEEDLKLFNEKDFYGIKEQKESLEFELGELKNREKVLIKRVAINTNCIFEIEQNLKTIKNLEEKFKVAKILSDVAKGSKKRIGFEKYVLTSCLNEVLMFANDWLKKLTANRFCFAALKPADSLNFNVFDAYSGKIRHVSTLSGGETFAASLALCLGLCLQVSSLYGGVELNTMLIDEGFGTLDKNYLESVIFCLNSLKKFGRNIGIISHLKELKSKIKTQVVVEKNSSVGSKIRVIS